MEQQNDLVFTTQGVIMGLIAYCVVGFIITIIFI